MLLPLQPARCPPFGDGVIPLTRGSIACRADRGVMRFAGVGPDGVTRWEQSFDVSLGDGNVRPYDCDVAVVEPFVLVYLYGEHAVGGTFHHHTLACLDVEGAHKWRKGWQIATCLAVRGGLVYAVVWQPAARREPARLSLRAVDLATGDEVLDDDLLARSAASSLVGGHQLLERVRFVEDASLGLMVALPACSLRVP